MKPGLEVVLQKKKKKPGLEVKDMHNVPRVCLGRDLSSRKYIA